MKRQDGFALPLTLSIVAVLIILITSTTIGILNGIYNTSNDIRTTQAEEVANVGFKRFKTMAFQTFRFYVKNQDLYAQVAAKSAQCGNLLSIGLDMGRDGISTGVSSGQGDANDLLNGQSYTGTVSVGSSTGTYKVTYISNGPGIILRSEGTVNGARAIVQGFLSGQNASAFSNAIYSGAGGQVGAHLNGSADIYGSVYVEGDPNDPDALNANGNFGIHNFYSNSQLQTISGLSSSQLGSFLKLQALEQKDMCATVRARYGKINFSAGSSIGDTGADVPAGFKGTMKGVYAGSANAAGTYDVNSYISGNVSTETKGPFDLNPPPVMPKLDSRGIVELAKLPADVRTALSSDPTWRETLQMDASKRGLTIQMNGGTVTTSPSSITCNITSVVSSGTLQFATTPIVCQDLSGRGFKYYYDATASSYVLDINGTLDLRGLDVKFTQNIIVRYEGKASMLVEKLGGVGGNVTIEGDVLPSNSFPDRDVLGIIAENNLTVTGANQNQNNVTNQQVVTGLFYAGNQITAVKDSVVMGTLMGDKFDLSNGANGGSAKTQILQVPGLEYNLPPGFSALKNANVPSFTLYSYERK